MRILITGGCGFLGSHLVEHFLKTTDAEIVILDKLSYASNGLDRLREVRAGIPDGDRMFFERVRSHSGCDLSLPLSFGVMKEIGHIDYIIHAAAESHVDHSIKDPLPFLMSNVLGTHHILWAARLMQGVKRVFLISTDEVYGPAPFDPIPPLAPSGPGDDGPAYTDSHMAPGFNEGAPFRPANPYAAAKAGGEMLGMAYANTYGLPITVVNTMNLIGERQHPEKFVPMVIRKVLAGETVSIHADATRTRSGTRFYLHCRTFANALGWLIGCDPGSYGTMRLRRGNDRFEHVDLPLKVHVCGEREISNLDLAQMITGILNRGGYRAALANPEGGAGTLAAYEAKLKYELVDFHSSRPGHDLRYAMDDSLIRDMGWVRPMNLEQSLEKTVHWYLHNPHWLDLKKEN